MPRQRLPATFWQTGHLDVARWGTIQFGRSMTGERVLPLLVDQAYAIDIDTPDQWTQAEALLLRGTLRVVRPPARVEPRVP
jgi:hypothetical protein